MHKNSAELPSKYENNSHKRNYKLEEPFRIQDSYARPQTYKQTINHTIKMIRIL